MYREVTIGKIIEESDEVDRACGRMGEEHLPKKAFYAVHQDKSMTSK